MSDSAKGPTVLLVIQNRDVCQVVSSVLIDDAGTIISAFTAEDALKRLKTGERYDVIVVDYDTVNGRSYSDELRRWLHNRCSGSRIVYISEQKEIRRFLEGFGFSTTTYAELVGVVQLALIKLVSPILRP